MTSGKAIAVPAIPTAGEATRRDFLYVATGVTAAIGAAATAWPLVSQMDPDASTIAEGGPVDLDISGIQPGLQVVVRWRKKPILVVNRPPEVLERLRDPKLLAQLRDPQSENARQPRYADNWHRSIKPQFVVLIGICTHLGCIPVFYPKPDERIPTKDWLGGYFCACHGSKYDLAGRVFKDVPAPQNLAVPPYRFVDDNIIRIGEDPPPAKPAAGA